MVTTEHIQSCYQALVQSTGLDLKFTTALNYQLERFCFEGFTAQDIRIVVGYIKKRIRAGRREKESLLPRNLIVRTDNFAEDLSMARSELREFAQRPDPSKESVLKATGRSAVKETTERSAAAIMEQHEQMATMLKQWKEQNL